MKTQIKNEFWCKEHYEERLKILLDRKHQYVIDIIDSGAMLAFSSVDPEKTQEKCKAPHCDEQATRLYSRTDFYPGEVIEQ